MNADTTTVKVDPLLRADDACRILGISRGQLQIMLTRGELRPVRIGRLIRFTTAEIERFVKEAQVGGIAE